MAIDAVGEESLDTAEVLASASAAPAPQAEPLDLGNDPSAVIIAGEGDAETLNRIGWQGTELPVEDCTAHLGHLGFNVRADATEGIEYIFAVTAVGYPGS